jgi:hypothetical protein
MYRAEGPEREAAFQRLIETADALIEKLDRAIETWKADVARSTALSDENKAYLQRVLPIIQRRLRITVDQAPGWMERATRKLEESAEPFPQADGDDIFTAGVEEEVDGKISNVAETLKNRIRTGPMVVVGPDALKTHGQPLIEFIDRLRKESPPTFPQVGLIGEGAAAYQKAYPDSVVLAAENWGDLTPAALAFLKPGGVIYVGEKGEAEAALGKGVEIQAIPAASDFSEVLRQLLHTLSGLSAEVLLTEKDPFSGINFNELAENLKKLARLGV